MELIWSTDKTSLIVRLSGDIDATNINEIEKTMNEVTDDVTEIVFDLEQLEYISSSGLRVLISMQKKMMKLHGKMTVKNPNDEIMQIFKVTGYQKVLNIVRDE